MSYCRFGKHSDVYMYPSIRGYIDCCACRLVEPGEFQSFYTHWDAIKHLWMHVLKGHKVELDTFWRLFWEMIHNENPANWKRD